MELLSKAAFVARTTGGWPVKSNVSIYADMPFECACGRTHHFSGKTSEVARELSQMRFVFRCPQRSAMTCVYVKGLISVELVSEFGCRDEGEGVKDKNTPGDQPSQSQRQKINLYSILGVLPTAEDVVIRAAYKALAQRYHPDRYQGSKAESEQLMKELNNAYTVLSDPEMRRKYDESIGGGRGGHQRQSNNTSSQTRSTGHGTSHENLSEEQFKDRELALYKKTYAAVLNAKSITIEAEFKSVIASLPDLANEVIKTVLGRYRENPSILKGDDRRQIVREILESVQFTCELNNIPPSPHSPIYCELIDKHIQQIVDVSLSVARFNKGGLLKYILGGVALALGLGI